MLEELDKVSGIIGEAGKGAETINKDNVKPGDKSRLEAARKELEDVLEEYGGHLTDAEKESVNPRLTQLTNCCLSWIKLLLRKQETAVICGCGLR